MSAFDVTVTVKSNVEMLEIYEELIKMREQLNKLLEKTELTMSVETSSAKEKERQPLNEQELHCIARHMKEFVEAAINCEWPDLVRPCHECPYRSVCGMDWGASIRKLTQQTGISISFHCNGDADAPPITKDIH